jgi:hypothetical protein
MLLLHFSSDSLGDAGVDDSGGGCQDLADVSPDA